MINERREEGVVNFTYRVVNKMFQTMYPNSLTHWQCQEDMEVYQFTNKAEFCLNAIKNSSHSYKGHSLNSYWAKGPDAYMNNLLAALLKFRENKIGIVGDIRKMFWRINIATFLCESHFENKVVKHVLSHHVFYVKATMKIRLFNISCSLMFFMWRPLWSK